MNNKSYFSKTQQAKISYGAKCRIETAENVGVSISMTVYLDGEIDHHTARGLREQIDAAIRRETPGLLVLDFRDVTFMDSSGIGLIMGRYKQMKLHGGEVHITNPSTGIKKILQLAGMDRLATI